jgi:hypothetical protein
MCGSKKKCFGAWLRYRVEVRLKALAFTGAVAFLLFLTFVYPAFSSSAECDPGRAVWADDSEERIIIAKIQVAR